MKTLFGRIMDWIILTVTILFDMFMAFCFGGICISITTGGYFSDYDVCKYIFSIVFMIVVNGLQFLIRMWIRTYSNKK